ncbi:hypothetical protein GRF59_24800 [Paenibacillus sp. HJL G12]|uniref:DUF4340 domain-containing protein n=1 Tax=Paenibacillus dendrobii TaxID=2691084 RepID=A0A7X3IMS3_9BACL|nr:hypothetical protein [Paenibacillus dendrobii]MWV46833.1 hypothetical protein [Paenibacillus dendrobii]
MAKKWIPAVIIVVCMILIAGAAYVFHPYQTAAPGEESTGTTPSDTSEQAGEGEIVWANKDVTVVEWDGKRTSWMLKRADEQEGTGSRWTLNGSPISTEQVKTIVSQMNALLSLGSDSSRKASSLKAEVIDSTVTIFSGPDHGDKVYQIAVEPDEPDTLWIIPAGESMIYPVPLDGVQQLEKNIDRLKASSSAH